MNAERNCQSCDNYKNEYCNVLDMKPCYPEQGCDYFETRMNNIQKICDCAEEIAEWLKDYNRLLVQQPNTGYWRKVDTNMYTCSNCNHCFSIVPEDNSIEEYKYCPNCKTMMIKIKESEG